MDETVRLDGCWVTTICVSVMCVPCSTLPVCYPHHVIIVPTPEDDHIMGSKTCLDVYVTCGTDMLGCILMAVSMKSYMQ